MLLSAERRRRLLAAAAFLGAVGCSADADEAGARVHRGGQLDSVDGARGGDVPATEVRFLEPALELAPGEAAPVVAQVSPPGRYNVRFAILGDTKDGFLDRSESASTADGSASVLLTAPISPAIFTVSASVPGGGSAQLPVSVSEAFTTLEVRPAYTGPRQVNAWLASVHAGVACAALQGSLPPDGPLRALASADTNAVVPNVPVGVPLAVTVRAGEFAGGCTDLDRVLADRRTLVTVPASDRPLRLDAAELELSLGFDDSDEWTAALYSTSASMAAALRGAATDEAAALLDAMEDAAGAGGAGFRAARDDHGWDAEVRARLDPREGGVSLLSTTARWLREGGAALAGPHGMEGLLTSADPAAGRARLQLAAVWGISPDAAGFPAANNVTWTADPDDTVHLGARLFWLPSLLLTELALTPALEAAPAASSVPAALAELLDCPALGHALVATTAMETAYDGCGGSCVAELCRRGVKQLWQRVRQALLQPVTLDLAATGRAAVDTAARPVGFEGRWVGSMVLIGDSELRLTGAAVGTAPTRP